MKVKISHSVRAEYFTGTVKTYQTKHHITEEHYQTACLNSFVFRCFLKDSTESMMCKGGGKLLQSL